MQNCKKTSVRVARLADALQSVEKIEWFLKFCWSKLATAKNIEEAWVEHTLLCIVWYSVVYLCIIYILIIIGYIIKFIM